MVLRWAEEGVALVADSGFTFLAAVYKHLMLRARLTNQAATSPAVMPSVKLQTSNRVFTLINRTLKYRKQKLKIISHHAELLTLADHAHVMLGVRDPVLAGWGLVWGLELG